MKGRYSFSTLVTAGVLFVAGALLWRYWDPVTAFLSDPTEVHKWLIAIGPLGPVAIVLFQVVQIVVAPIPGGVAGAVAGFLYGFWAGLGLNVVGGILGSSLAIVLGRKLGRPLVQRIADGRVIQYVSRYNRVRSVPVWILVFALPIGDPLLFAAGLTQVSLVRLVIAAVFGRLPAQVLSTLTGSSSATFGVVATIAAVLIGGVLMYLFHRYRHRLEPKSLALAEQPVPIDD